MLSPDYYVKIVFSHNMMSLIFNMAMFFYIRHKDILCLRVEEKIHP